MNHLIHDSPTFRLEVRVTEHPRFVSTIEFITIWPTANHPEPHKHFSLTLPCESFATLADVLHRLDGETSGLNQQQ